MKRYILPLFLFTLGAFPASAQDIILLNQDGEKVGVAKNADDKPVAKDKVVETKPDKGSAKIENGIVTIVGPDGKVQSFELSDARSVAITRSSNTVIGEDGLPEVTTQSKAILVGPDGVRREIDLGDEAMGRPTADSKQPKTWTIGVSCEPVSTVLRSQLLLDDDIGLVVSRVHRGSPAEKANIKLNDILLYAGQKSIGNQKQLSEAVNEAGAEGNELTFAILRGGEEVSASVKPAERKGSNPMLGKFGPRMGGFGMGLPDPGAAMELEFKDFGPEIIIGDGDIERLAADELHRKLMRDLRENMKDNLENRLEQMREEMKEMQRQMQEDR